MLAARGGGDEKDRGMHYAKYFGRGKIKIKKSGNESRGKGKMRNCIQSEVVFFLI